jgi:molybdopterin synthase catalytic subunit
MANSAETRDKIDRLVTGERVSIELTRSPIDSNAVLDRVQGEDCGANVLFLGKTRRWTGEEETSFLCYEAYEAMAIQELMRLANEAIDKFLLSKVAIVHRLGIVDIGQASIAVAISGQHRKGPFDAGPWLMDKIKKDVPIWKQDRNLAKNQTAWIHPE